MLRKYQDINLDMKARPIITIKPLSVFFPNILRIKPAKKAQATLTIPKSRLRQPKYLPLLDRGIWSDIRLTHAGTGKALKEVARVTNNISHSALSALNSKGIKNIGRYMKAWKKTNILIMRIRLLKCSVTSADLSWISDATKFGKAVSMPICALVALSATANGVMYCSVNPIMAE